MDITESASKLDHGGDLYVSVLRIFFKRTNFIIVVLSEMRRNSKDTTTIRNEANGDETRNGLSRQERRHSEM